LPRAAALPTSPRIDFNSSTALAFRDEAYLPRAAALPTLNRIPVANLDAGNNTRLCGSGG
jgi:hypothetical protein